MDIVQIINGVVSYSLEDTYLGQAALAEYSSYDAAISAAKENAEKAKEEYQVVSE